MIPPEVHFCGVETLAEGMGHIGIWARQAAALQMRQIQRYVYRFRLPMFVPTPLHMMVSTLAAAAYRSILSAPNCYL